jgi:hypothetical protein
VTYDLSERHIATRAEHIRWSRATFETRLPWPTPGTNHAEPLTKDEYADLVISAYDGLWRRLAESNPTAGDHELMLLADQVVRVRMEANFVREWPAPASEAAE